MNHALSTVAHILGCRPYKVGVRPQECKPGILTLVLSHFRGEIFPTFRNLTGNETDVDRAQQTVDTSMILLVPNPTFTLLDRLGHFFPLLRPHLRGPQVERGENKAPALASVPLNRHTCAAGYTAKREAAEKESRSQQT